MKRREFLRMAGGTTAAATAAAGTAAAQEGEGGGGAVQPDFGGHLDGVDGGYQDNRGQSEVTVEVGAAGNGGDLAFSPAGMWIDPGTTVTWEWTGNGGGHNVIASEGASLDSGSPVAEAGTTYEYTFEEGDAGITKYHCAPHEALGMKGAVAVGGDVATVSVGGSGGEKELEELGVPIQAHWVGAATILGIIVTMIYSFFILKYGESANTGNTGGGE